MRDRTHKEQVIRWAEYVKKHPRSVWIKEVKPLIDSQIIMANNFYERHAKTEGGIERIRNLREIKNKSSSVKRKIMKSNTDCADDADAHG